MSVKLSNLCFPWGEKFVYLGRGLPLTGYFADKISITIFSPNYNKSRFIFLKMSPNVNIGNKHMKIRD